MPEKTFHPVEGLDGDADIRIAGIVLIGTDGSFLLQERDRTPTISSPGRIGMFGGHREGAEGAAECALREVEEETGLTLAPERLRPVVRIRSAHADGGVREGAFFLATGVDAAALRVSEGKLIAIAPRDIGQHYANMVPTTAYVIALVLEQGWA